MEKKIFIGVLYLTIFVTFSFILLITYMEKRLQVYVDRQKQTEGDQISLNLPTITVAPTSTPKPTPTPVLWLTYTDPDNGFSIDYPSTRLPYEKVTEGYHSIDFYSGCFVITSGNNEQISKLVSSEPIPWSKIDSLSLLNPGQEVSYVVDTWNLGKGEKFDLTYTYFKKNPRKIGTFNWNTFSVNNNYENHGNLMQYFLYKNEKYYFISSLTGGPCWTEEPERMLDSFVFLSK